MKKEIIAAFVVAFLIFSLPALVSAATTSISVKTLPNHRVTIIVYPKEKLSSLESFYIDSDANGMASVSHTSSESEIDVLVKITKDGNKVFLDKFTGYDAGTPISIRIDNEEITGNYIPAETTIEESTDNESDTSAAEENTAPSENSNLDNVDTGQNPGVTGEVVSGESSGSYAKVIYYVVGILAALLIALFVVRTFIIRRNGFMHGHGKGFGFSSGPSDSAPSANNIIDSSDVRRLKSQLESSQREIRLLRNQEKIREVEFKIKEEQKELDRMKRGL